MTTTMSLTALLVILALVASFTNAHMMMSNPPPRQSKGNPGPNGQIDFSYTSPLGAFPCKGYPAQAPVLTVAAGSSIPITLDGGAPHDGGHCQFALSYDGDKTFVVIETIIRECMRRANPFQTTITIPPNAPSGKATLAWSWLNAVGNREYYMSCADIQVTGGSGPTGSLSGPELLVAHLPGFTQFSFPEFGGNAPDNRVLFDQRRTITVRGNGGAGDGGAAPQPPRNGGGNGNGNGNGNGAAPQPPRNGGGNGNGNGAAPTPAPQRPTPTPPAAAQPAPPAASPTAPPRSGRDQRDTDNQLTCTNGKLECGATAGTFRMCANGRFVDFQLAPGTTCTANGDSITINNA